VVSERHGEIGLLVGLFGTTFSMVALLGFHPEDPTWLHPGDTAVLNPCGPVGALISDVLFTGVGHGAWLMFLGMVGFVMALAGRMTWHWPRMALLAVSYCCVLALLHLGWGPGTWFAPGGELGRVEAELLRVALGSVGAWMAVLGGLMLLGTVIFEVRWGRLASRIIGRMEHWLPIVGGRLGASGAAVRGWAGDVGRAGWQQGHRSVKRSVMGGWSTVRRMGRSLIRQQGDYGTDTDLLHEHDDDAFEGLNQPHDTFDPVSDINDRTAVGVPLAVAEVHWEPTADVSMAQSDVLNMFPVLTPRPSSIMDAPVPSVGTALDRDVATSPSEGPNPSVAQPAAAVAVALPTRPSIPMPSSSLAAVAVKVQTEAPGKALSPALKLKMPGPELKKSAAIAMPVPTPQPAQPQVKETPTSVEIRAAEAMKKTPKQDNGRAIRKQKRGDFQLPGLKLLDIVPRQHAEFDAVELRRLARTIEETLAAFKVEGHVTDVRVGPVVTTFEYLPAPGIKVSKLASLSDDLAMALKSESVRIEVRSEKGVVGIEMPSPQRLTIYLRELMASEAFRTQKMALPCIIGKDVEGRPVIQDLAKMPHLLVGGTTGSGKSVGVNGMLMSMLFTRTPDELRLLLVDPKILEFKMYENIPHLLHPVVTEPKKAAAALAWACREMDDRYALLAAWDTRSIANYNDKIERESKSWNADKARRYCPPSEDPAYYEPVKLPYIVIVIDELADLMLQAKKDVEESIARIAQKARACGIHLIVATQRPSADIVTGLIKSNLPTRLSFKLKTGLDSRVILDCNGAERLLGRGDCLLSPNGSDMMRCHGAFVSDEEVFRVVDYLRTQGEPQYIEAVTEDVGGDDIDEDDLDDLYFRAADFVREKGKASTSMVQRQFKIGYNRAANIVDQLENKGVIGPADGARPREILG
jgi:S-DNA-T family DNA segregation ATPase FtsK/SpoIIIE